MRGFFVTGTGTGVGKTFVTSSLARRIRERGQRVFAFKPIETGCVERDGVLVGADQEAIAVAAGDWQRDELRRLYCFERPASPRAAAGGAAISLSRIRDVFVRGASQSDWSLVEGAGGWRVPITDAADTSALARAIELPVLVVAQAGLGTINHTVLTVEAVARDGLDLGGVILSCRPEDDRAFAMENAEEIERLSGCRTWIWTDSRSLDGLLGFT